MIICADASYSPDRDRWGYGVASDRGLRLSGALPSDVDSSLTAEVAAIAIALQHAKHGVTVTSDCAIALIKIAGRRLLHQGKNFEITNRYLKLVWKRLEGTGIQLQWVRGHAGDPINTEADALARIGRLAESAETLHTPHTS